MGLWQVKGGTIFDNVIITDDKAEADNFAKKWKDLSEVEQAKKKEEDDSKKAADDKKDEKDEDDDDDEEDKKESEDMWATIEIVDVSCDVFVLSFIAAGCSKL